MDKKFNVLTPRPRAKPYISFPQKATDMQSIKPRPRGPGRGVFPIKAHVSLERQPLAFASDGAWEGSRQRNS